MCNREPSSHLLLAFRKTPYAGSLFPPSRKPATRTSMCTNYVTHDRELHTQMMHVVGTTITCRFFAVADYRDTYAKVACLYLEIDRAQTRGTASSVKRTIPVLDSVLCRLLRIALS